MDNDNPSRNNDGPDPEVALVPLSDPNKNNASGSCNDSTNCGNHDDESDPGGDFFETVLLLMEIENEDQIREDVGRELMKQCSADCYWDRADFLLTRKLVENSDANLMHQDNFGRTPLHIACTYGNLRMVEYFTERGGKCLVDILGENGAPPPVVALREGYHEIAKYFVEKFEIDMRQTFGKGQETILHVAVGTIHHGENDPYGLVECLLKKAADANALDAQGYSPLHLTCANQNANVIQTLLSHGANVNLRSPNDGKTPLHMVFYDANGAVPKINMLLEAGANVNAKDTLGDTALTLACRDGLVRAAQILLEHGANVGHANNAGKTPLQLAVEDECAETVQLLLDHGLTLDNENARDVVALAASYSSWEMVSLLLEHGASPNGFDENGNSALVYACRDCQLRHVNLILEHGARVNAVGQSQLPALHIACQHFDAEIIDALLEAGADIHAVDKRGDTPLQILIKCWGMQKRSSQPTAQRLIEEGARLDIINSRGDNLLTCAAIYPREQDAQEAFQFLMRQDGMNLQQQGQRALIAAATKNRKEVVRFLMEALAGNVQNEGWGFIVDDDGGVGGDKVNRWEWSDWASDSDRDSDEDEEDDWASDSDRDSDEDEEDDRHFFNNI